MIPLRLIIQDFMNHKYSDIDFTLFNSALIVGKNGIGKTTVYSAIEFVFFGEVPTSTLDKVVRDGADKCIVIFDFKIGDIKYRVLRGRSSKGRSELKLYEFIGDKWESISQRGMPETAKKLAEILKINHKSFIHSIKFGQADFNGLASFDAEKRKSILKEPLELGNYTKLEKIATKKIGVTKKEIEKLETSIAMLGDPETDIKTAEAELIFCQTTIQARHDTVDKLTNTISNKQSALFDIKKSLNNSDFEIHDNINALNKRAKELKFDFEKSNEQIQKTDILIKENKSAIISMQSIINEFVDVQKELNENKYRDKTLIQVDLEKTTSDELFGTKLLAKLEAEYDHINKSVPTNNICPSCFQEITEEHRQKCLEQSTKLLEEKSEKIRVTKANLTKCTNKKLRIQEELKECIEHDRALRNAIQKQENAQSQIDIRTKQVKDAEAQSTQAALAMHISQTELSEINNTLVKLKEIANNSNVAEINKKIFELTDEIKVYERSLQNVRSELSSAQNRLGAATERLKTGTENLDRLTILKTELLQTRKVLKIQQIGVNGFSPSGIPTFIIHTILDEYQLESNKWLSKLRPELALEFNADVEMFYRVNDKLKEWEQLSIGQKIYITLSLKLGLAKIIQNKLGIDIKLLLLDEVEAFFDAEGVEAYCNILKQLETDFKLLVISHSDLVKERMRTTILVEGDEKNGASTKLIGA